MLAVTLNPGFVLILGALAVLATPLALRGPVMLSAAFAAMWLLLDREFGAAGAVAHMGLTVVPFLLDELSQVFGIAFIAAAILLAIYASARRNRYEDAAIMLLAGGAVSALFVGDLVSFVAASAVAGLAAAWVVLAAPSPGASAAGVRMLVWHGLEGLLFLVGVAFHISAGVQELGLGRLSLDEIGGGFIFAALMIRVGAPLAHVWLKDVVSHASSAGGAALSAYSTMLGVYALARLFPGEPGLIPIGAAMIVLGVFFAAAEDDLRSAAAYGLIAQTGVCVALIGIGTPLALSGAEAHAFASIFAFLLLQMALGAVLDRTGTARASQIVGVGRAMPVSAALMLTAGLAAAGAPGFATYASFAVVIEAAAQWQTRWLWALIAASSAGLFVSLALRPALSAHLAPAKPSRFREAPFTMLLAMGLAAFLCLAVGLTPAWLYRLMPTELAFAPFALDRVAPQIELLGAAGAAYLALRALRLAPKERTIRLLDLDTLYSGPIAGAGRWAGVVMLRLHGAWQAGAGAMSERAGHALGAWARNCDRPYSGQVSSAAPLAAIFVALLIILAAGG